MDQTGTKKYEVDQIGMIRSCYAEKFGIPRQPGLVDKAHSYLTLNGVYGRQETVHELTQFSHVWILFLFHETIAEGWKTTVRPPGLGGQKRVGVFASRSPHRPNHLGMSVVELITVFQGDEGVTLKLGGGDFLDKTPVLDIKPYLPYCDSVEEAKGGYAGMVTPNLEVMFSEEAERFCRDYKMTTKRDLKGVVTQVLTQDPRPASQRGRKVEFGMRLWDVNIRWRVEGEVFLVVGCQDESGSVEPF